jgi:pyruvate, water dikinase
VTIVPEQPEAARPGFPNPFEVETAPGCDGWEEMYPYHTIFTEERREADEGRFWFWDGVHCPEPVYPFDCIWLDYGIAAFNQSNARLFVIPPSLGIEYRLLNGYVYFSGNQVTDEAALARRAAEFARRGGFYYQHWDELYERWVEKIEVATRELVELEVPELPELEDIAVVTEARGVGSTFALLAAYDRLIQGFDRVWQYHFELNSIGYGAYLVFYDLCRQFFPGITDQSIATMLSGIDVLVLRPDAELRRLARNALELGVGDAVRAAADEDDLRAALSGEAGAAWLADLEETKDPWFHFSFGNGLAHDHRSWIDDTSVPLRTIGSYIGRLEAGEEIDRPLEAVVAERDRIADEYRSLLPDESRQAFDENLALCRTVFPFVENHNFYVEHRYLTSFWNKVREFGALLADDGFLATGEDVFFLRRGEVREAIEELRLHWSAGRASAPRGPSYWPPLIARRKQIHESMREWTPPQALGPVPDAITDPSMTMLWGITPERLESWLGAAEDDDAVSGVGGSPGLADGLARVILRADQLGELEPGEILVARSTSTSWTPVFGTIAAAVLDTGGIMCHAAIIAREYGLPAVVGTGTATKRIKTGDRLHVDANTGVVTIL